MHSLTIEHLPGGNIPTLRAMVYINQNFLFPIGAVEQQFSVMSIDKFYIAISQSRQFFQAAQLTEMLHKFPVFPAPGICAAVERVFISLHAGLVAIVQAGTAGERILQHGCQIQPAQRQFPLPRR